ncbi:uncharacterized protein C8A04DRAFT_26517 [Dichotomopilus funicola]|uniref:Uncharacterized protein n=1 Tax=Dichotomopilus funicola TaxID=1934379 RepID=A0AAN6V854_9PEZI|nr:hypothetical protein C8A04DRAFT_26517 [Dichotomopilus funicola]
MPVPWARSGNEKLTTDLALWWMCMLSMSAPEHRALMPEEDAVGVGEWEKRQGLDGWVRQHRYSNFQEPSDPPTPPPPAYRDPSPGNPAAFAAGVGVNGNDDFDLGEDFDLDLDVAEDIDWGMGANI